MLLQSSPVRALNTTIPSLPDLRIYASEDLDVKVEAAEGTAVLTASSTMPMLLGIEVPLGDPQGYWYPGERRSRSLPTDWSASVLTSAVNRAPMGFLYDELGRTTFGFVCTELDRIVEVSAGVNEENMTFAVLLKFPEELNQVKLAVTTVAQDLPDAIGAARSWLARNYTAIPVPEAAVVPAYSTWYSYLQEVDSASILSEGRAAANLGMKTLFLDDGWQRLGTGRYYQGCGDWIPDSEKFPDLAKDVEELQRLGLATVAWLAPPLLGADSDAFEEMGRFAPVYNDRLRAHILDPRLPEVQYFFVETCRRLVRDYGFDGLKIDFLDTVMVYANTPGGDVGEAMREVLKQAIEAMTEELGRTPVVEYRQPYIGPGLAQFANVFRAGDCPADATANRVAICDTRYIAGNAAVHSDMVAWDYSAGSEAAAHQLMSAFFGVPQVSVRLEELPTHQQRALSYILSLWNEHRSTILDGTLKPSLPSDNYSIVRTWTDTNAVAGVFTRDTVVDLSGPADLKNALLLNANRGTSMAVKTTKARETARADIFTHLGELVSQIDLEFSSTPSWLDVPPYGVVRLAF